MFLNYLNVVALSVYWQKLLILNSFFSHHICGFSHIIFKLAEFNLTYYVILFLFIMVLELSAWYLLIMLNFLLIFTFSNKVFKWSLERLGSFLTISDFNDSFLLVFVKVEDLSNWRDKHGDDECTPKSIDNGNSSTKGRHSKDITITNSGHCDDYAPHCCHIGIKHYLTLTLIINPI